MNMHIYMYINIYLAYNNCNIILYFSAKFMKRKK